MKLNVTMAEQGIATKTERATILESGARPLEESNLPLHIPRQPALPIASKEQVRAQAWSFAELLGQEKLVKTIYTDGSTGKPEWTFHHTLQNVLDMHFGGYKSFFRLYSWKLHFRIQFRSVFQQVGQALVVQHCIPPTMLAWLLRGTTYNDDVPAELYKSYRLMTQLSHTKVPLGEDTEVECEMDWNIPMQGASDNLSYSYREDIGGKIEIARPTSVHMGSIFIMVPFKMEIAQNVTPQFSIRIWSRLSDITMAGYDPNDKFL